MIDTRESDDDLESGYRDVPVRRVLEQLRYSVTRALAASDEELELVADDYRDGAVSVIPATEFLEELRATSP